jgi:hypothetical protein
MQEHFCLADGVSEAEASSMFNKDTWKVIKDAFKDVCWISIAIYYTHVLKQQMKPTQMKEIYLTKDQHLQGIVDCLVKDLEAWDWLCGWWASEDFRVISK